MSQLKLTTAVIFETKVCQKLSTCFQRKDAALISGQETHKLRKEAKL